MDKFKPQMLNRQNGRNSHCAQVAGSGLNYVQVIDVLIDAITRRTAAILKIPKIPEIPGGYVP